MNIESLGDTNRRGMLAHAGLSFAQANELGKLILRLRVGDDEQGEKFLLAILAHLMKEDAKVHALALAKVVFHEVVFPHHCIKCNSKGYVPILIDDDGEVKLGKMVCDKCHGLGLVQNSQRDRVKISGISRYAYRKMQLDDVVEGWSRAINTLVQETAQALKKQ